MKVALVHDWLTGMRGGERCLDEFLKLYPDADVYTLVHEPGATNERIDQRVRGTSVLQRFPLLRKHYRMFLPLFPLLARTLVVKDYDLVISLSHAAAKNVKLVNVGKHICYCFTPMRYIWDMAPHYLGDIALLLFWPLIQYLRRWDKRGADQVDHFVAISRFVAARIRKFYGRDSSVVYPPVIPPRTSSVQLFADESAFLYAGAFVPYKGVDDVIEVFNELELPLWCVGSGPLEATLKKKAKGNIRFFGSLTDEELASMYRSCRALVFPAKEDFGIIPIEALFSGKPVIAGYHGATRETIPGVRPWLNESWEEAQHAGMFFRRPRNGERQALLKVAVKQFLKYEDRHRESAAVSAAKRFSVERFRRGWQNVVEGTSILGDNTVSLYSARHRERSVPQISRVRARV